MPGRWRQLYFFHLPSRLASGLSSLLGVDLAIVAVAVATEECNVLAVCRPDSIIPGRVDWSSYACS